MRLIVGLDPGVTTGFAVWDSGEKRITEVTSMAIHRAMGRVSDLRREGELARVIFEDARQRTWFGLADKRQAAAGAGIREGVGSIKRDCTIWQDFLTDLGVEFVMRRPTRGTTKWSPAYFAKVTGWTGRTNNHGRDAAALLVGVL